MSNKSRVMDIYYEDPVNITQLRLGRIRGMEQKGLIDDSISDDEIRELLDPDNREQQVLDAQRLAEIRDRQEKPT